MTGHNAPEELPRRARGEGELTAQLITAATKAEERLSQDQIDEILGVDDDR